MIPRRHPWLLAALSGVLLALSFPKFGHPALSWIAVVPLLVALGAGSLVRAFCLGTVTGIFYFAGTLYWTTHVMSMYGGMAYPVAVLVNVLLVAWMALFTGLFAMAMRRVLEVAGGLGLLAAPCVWVAAEYARGLVFPWVSLGYSQTTVLPVAQLASVFGIYGLSGLVMAVNAAVAHVAFSVGWVGSVRWVRSVGSGGAGRASVLHRYAPLAATVALVLGVAAWGSRRVARAELTRTGDPVRVGLVQGNVDQAEKWDERRAAEIFARYIRMSRQAIGGGAELVIWPESSMPFYFEEEGSRSAAAELRRLAREAAVPILIGSDQIEHGPPVRYFNAAFLVGPDGVTRAVYRKIHLVPFGEYVPFKRLLFFAGPLVEAVSDFSPGTEWTLLPVDGHRISTAICYEIVYPALVRRFVSEGSELLTTITNDAWFGRTSAPYQHFEQASLRAIEEGRYLVRSANTGVSGIVDPYGRVVAASRIFEPSVIVGTARYLQERTVYSRIGDAFAYGSIVVTLLLLVQSLAWRQLTT